MHNLLIILAALTISATKATAQPNSARPLPLWDEWYTVTLNGGMRYEYYNEKVEIKDGKVYFFNRAWKKEEDFINEEQLGAVAGNVPDLPPLFYNFHATYRSTETVIDGSVQDGNALTVKVKRGTQDFPAIKKILPKRVILSTLFPVWLGFRLSTMKPGQPQSFLALIEDDPQLRFSPVSGLVRLEKPDDIAQKTQTRKIAVHFNGMKSSWWVDPKGMPVRIEMISQKALVEKTTAEKAKRFLSGN